MAAKRIVITLSNSPRVDWRIEVELHGAWHETVYAGCSPSVDDAFVTAKRHLVDGHPSTRLPAD